MDPEAARMLADLGVARRDIVSAPDADAKGRTLRENPNASRATVNSFEERRRRIRDDAPEVTDRSVKLAAWNTEGNFDADHRAAGLVDRFSGQGHRVNLQVTLGSRQGHDSNNEAREARVGEERHRWLQERNRAVNGNYVVVSSPAQPQSQRGGGFGNSTPRSLADPNPPSVTRASSPRRAGGFRVVNGRRVELPAPSSRPRVAPSVTGTQAAPLGLRIRSKIETRFPAVANVLNRASHGANLASLESEEVATSAFNTQSATVSISPTPLTTMQFKIYRTQAYHWATHPGTDCDRHYLQFPGEVPYLREAQIALIKESFNMATDPDGSETVEYLRAHPDRIWMFREACLAKSMVEAGMIAELDARHAAKPELAGFGKPAKFYFRPNAQPLPSHGPPPEKTTNGGPPVSSTASFSASATKPPSPITAIRRAPNATSAPLSVKAPVAVATNPLTTTIPPFSITAIRRDPAPTAVASASTPGSTTLNRAGAGDQEGSPAAPASDVDNPPTRASGTLSAKFSTSDGNVVMSRDYALDFPARVDLSVYATKSNVKWVRLLFHVEAFAQSLRKRSMDGLRDIAAAGHLGSLDLAARAKDLHGEGTTATSNGVPNENEDPHAPTSSQ
ncbi:hypothetical protein LTR53_017625 [Teratosphaeriaceae sp. CCFEE 6253]|nr:hypothetical protein LTR53_017625 [Teratosphaeriaceae sp. CCFEE 6253]